MCVLKVALQFLKVPLLVLNVGVQIPGKVLMRITAMPVVGELAT